MVEAINGRNNNSTSAYSLGGLGVGALAGGTFGYLQKPWAKNGQVSDTFIRQYEKNQIKYDLTQFEKMVKDLKKISETGKLDDISDITKELLDECGINKELPSEDIKKHTSEILNDTMEAHEAKDIDELIKNSKKHYKNDTLNNATKIAKRWNDIKVSEGMTDDALKKVLKDNADLFEIKAENGKTLEEAVDTYFATTGGKAKVLGQITLKKIVHTNKANSRLGDLVENIDKHLDIKEKRMLDLASDATAEDKSIHGIVKKTVSQMNWKNAGKWAAITGAALGAIGLATGIIKNKNS